MLIRALFMVAALGASAASHATTGLAWRWGDAGHRYLLQSEVELPQPLWFRAEQNVDVRVTSFSVDLLTRCRPESEVGKKGWDLVCDIEDVRIDATPVGQESGRLQQVLDEMDGKLLDGHVEVRFLADGRIRTFDLEGVDKSNRRLQAIHEVLRQVLARAYAGLDLQLPRKGDDHGAGSWNQSTPLALHPPSGTGVLGKVVVEHTLGEDEGGVVQLRSAGRGTLGSGDTVAIDGQEQPLSMFAMSYEGTAAFDTRAGRLTERAYVVEGEPTASSATSEAGAGGRYVQRTRITYVPTGQEVPSLGPNAERKP